MHSNVSTFVRFTSLTPAPITPTKPFPPQITPHKIHIPPPTTTTCTAWPQLQSIIQSKDLPSFSPIPPTTHLAGRPNRDEDAAVPAINRLLLVLLPLLAPPAPEPPAAGPSLLPPTCFWCGLGVNETDESTRL